LKLRGGWVAGDGVASERLSAVGRRQRCCRHLGRPGRAFPV